MSSILDEEHIHLWSRTLDGAELGNALYRSDIDAALDFTAIVGQVTKYAENTVSIEEVMSSLTDGRGMYAGCPGFIVVVSRCDGGCASPSWN
jgi:hypothetical protein